MASDPPRNGQSEAPGTGDEVVEGAAAERVEIEPMETNDVLIVAIGTALFAVASVVLIALRTSLERSGHGRWPWIALSGALLGVVGLVYCVRRQQRMSKANAQ
jgi:uncharacterized membrane protein HdeD (DUF308 family)